MKCNSKSIRRKKAELALERRREAREKMLAEMSPEEREAFLAEEQASHERTMKKLAELLSVRERLGIRRYY